MTRWSVVGFINMLCGDGDRDALRADDYTFSASSRTTYMASLLVFGTVISDAAMVDRVIGMDVQEAAAARDRYRWYRLVIALLRGPSLEGAVPLVLGGVESQTQSPAVSIPVIRRSGRPPVPRGTSLTFISR